MDAAQSGSITQLLNLGLPGIIILAMAYVIVKLFNMLIATNEARIAENKALVQAISSNSSALEELSKAIEKRSSK